MRYIYYLFALLAGAALSFERGIYAELGKNIGKLETNFYNFFMGSILIGLIWIFAGKGKLSYRIQALKWQQIAAFLGVLYMQPSQKLELSQQI